MKKFSLDELKAKCPGLFGSSESKEPKKAPVFIMKEAVETLKDTVGLLLIFGLTYLFALMTPGKTDGE